jgi:hypothetical protein
MVGHHSQLLDAHLPGYVQPRPDPARHQQSVDTHDFIVKELPHMAYDAGAPGNGHGVRPGDMDTRIQLTGQEPGELPEGESGGVGCG